MLNLSNFSPLSTIDERDSSNSLISTMKTQTESITTIAEDEIIQEAGYDPETKEKMQELIEYLSEEFQGGKKKENVEGMPKIGDIIDTFTIRGTIGHGGTGTVFVAERKGLLYAIKCATKSKDLEHEFGIAKKCRSKPRLLKCCKYGETDKINYMVMELADLSFHDFWREFVDVDDINAEERIKKACFYLSKGLQALEELHSLNLMHQDVKPNNFVMDIKNPDELILIDYSAAAKVENGICVENGYCGSTIFGARDALADRHRYWCITQDPRKQLQQHFKSDIESWFYCLILMANKETFMTFIADDMENMLEAKREIWSNRVIKHEFLSGMPTQFSSIMYMIDLIQPGESVNYRGIYDLLQQVVDGDYILIDGSLELCCTQCPTESSTNLSKASEISRPPLSKLTSAEPLILPKSTASFTPSEIPTSSVCVMPLEAPKSTVSSAMPPKSSASSATPPAAPKCIVSCTASEAPKHEASSATLVLPKSTASFTPSEIPTSSVCVMSLEAPKSTVSSAMPPKSSASSATPPAAPKCIVSCTASEAPKHEASSATLVLPKSTASFTPSEIPTSSVCVMPLEAPKSTVSSAMPPKSSASSATPPAAPKCIVSCTASEAPKPEASSATLESPEIKPLVYLEPNGDNNPEKLHYYFQNNIGRISIKEGDRIFYKQKKPVQNGEFWRFICKTKECNFKVTIADEDLKQAKAGEIAPIVETFTANHNCIPPTKLTV